MDASVDRRPKEQYSSNYLQCLHVFLVLCVLLPNWMNGVEVCALTLARDGESNQQTEHATVVEGGTLTMECLVATENLQQLWWGKQLDEDWLVGNGVVYSGDTRLSVDTIVHSRNLSTYTLQIRDTTTSDEGTYICYAIWNNQTSVKGFIHVSVILFPLLDPVCSTNKTNTTATSNIVVWCDTTNGNPQVDITWTVEDTGEVVLGRIYTYTLKGLEHVRSVLTLQSELQTHALVCTVTSSAFPNQNRTCFLSSVLNTSSSTEQLSTANTLSETTVGTRERTVTTSLPSTTRGTNPGHFFNTGPLLAIIVIPMLVIILSVIGFCILKRRKRRRNTKTGRRKQDCALVVTEGNEDGRDGENVNAPLCPSTQLENHDSAATGGSDSARDAILPRGEKSHSAPGEVAMDPAAGSVSWTQRPESAGDLHAYEIVMPDKIVMPDSDSDSVGQGSHENDSPHAYERVNSITGGFGAGESDMHGRGTDSNDNQEHGVTRSASDESETVMIKNPIYEPYDKR